MPEDDIIVALKKVIASSPNNIELVSHLAGVLAERKRFDESVKEYEKALKLNPRHVKSAIGLAKVYLEQNTPNLAEKYLEDAIWTEKNNEEANYLLGLVFEKKNDPKKAAEYFKRANEINPKPEYSSKLAQYAQTSAGIRVSSVPYPHDEAEVFSLEKPNVNFSSVGNLENVKQRIREAIIFPLKHSELYKTYKKKAGGGILLYGPPGCGKTHIAKATAGEADASFISVSISDVLDMWLGESEKKLKKVFEAARKHRPAIIFFDEIDAIGNKRIAMHGAGKTLVNQLLAEMDGIGSSNEQILFIGATNAPWDVDSALRRPGRFDHVLYVPPPNLESRTEIFRIHCAERPLAGNVDFAKLASKTKSFSGADISRVCEEAASIAMRSAMNTGKVRKIEMQDFNKAISETASSIKEWLATADNYAKYSNVSGLYDDLIEHAKDSDKPSYVR